MTPIKYNLRDYVKPSDSSKRSFSLIVGHYLALKVLWEDRWHMMTINLIQSRPYKSIWMNPTSFRSHQDDLKWTKINWNELRRTEMNWDQLRQMSYDELRQKTERRKERKITIQKHNITKDTTIRNDKKVRKNESHISCSLTMVSLLPLYIHTGCPKKMYF